MTPTPPEGCICASFWTVRQAHKSACPLATPSEEETIGISDHLTPYVQRINTAIAYMGVDDREDVRSILDGLFVAHTKTIRQQVIVEVRGKMPKSFSETGVGEPAWGDDRKQGFNQALDQINKTLDEMEADDGTK